MSPELWLLTGLAGFAAGLLDSIVGGGGLILTPAMLNLHPGLNILQAIGTQRTSSLLGTSVAAWNYFRHVVVERRIVVPALVSALAASAIGVQFAKRADPEIGAHIGEVLWQMGRKEEALQYFRESRQGDPENETLVETLKRLKIRL